jgi:hypothetical protein
LCTWDRRFTVCRGKLRLFPGRYLVLFQLNFLAIYTTPTTIILAITGRLQSEVLVAPLVPFAVILSADRASLGLDRARCNI